MTVLALVEDTIYELRRVESYIAELKEGLRVGIGHGMGSSQPPSVVMMMHPFEGVLRDGVEKLLEDRRALLVFELKAMGVEA